MLREVAEETAQQIELGELVKVQTSHWIGRSPRADIEDFHAVRLIYRATCRRADRPGGARPRRHDRVGALGARWTRWDTLLDRRLAQILASS